MRSAVFSFFILLPSFVIAAEPNTRSIEPLSTANLTKWTLGLFFVLVLIAVVAWGFKRFSSFGISQAGNMKILGGLSVGNREKVVLMRAGNSHLLLGITASQIQTLHVFDEGEIDESADQQPSNFQESLRKVLDKKKADDNA
jgi:flagellar protein FliO/FliZ